MILFTKNGSHPIPLPFADWGEDAGGNPKWFEPLANATPEELATTGWAEAPARPVFDNAAEAVEWDGKTSTWIVRPLDAEEVAETDARSVNARKQAINARLAEVFAAGFAPSHPAFAGERLQVRDSEDRTNWLTSQAAYAAAVAQGAGALQEATFRTMGNQTITVSYADGYAVLLEMAAWGKAVMGNSWRLKDALEAGEPYDLDAGWPG